MSTIYRTSLRWADCDEFTRKELEQQWAEEAAEAAYYEQQARRLQAIPEREAADYSGDRLLDGPEADMFGRPIR